jgi:hypothetical protein
VDTRYIVNVYHPRKAGPGAILLGKNTNTYNTQHPGDTISKTGAEQQAHPQLRALVANSSPDRGISQIFVKAPNLFKTNILINLFLREGGWGRNKRGVTSK